MDQDTGRCRSGVCWSFGRLRRSLTMHGAMWLENEDIASCQVVGVDDVEMAISSFLILAMVPCGGVELVGESRSYPRSYFYSTPLTNRVIPHKEVLIINACVLQRLFTSRHFYSIDLYCFCLSF